MADSRYFTRREFLSDTAGIAAASTAAAVLTRSTAVAKSHASDEPWQIGCYTRPWGQYDYRVALDAIA